MNERLKELLKNIEEANRLIIQLDPAVKATAFEKILSHLSTKQQTGSQSSTKAESDRSSVASDETVDTSSRENFFGQFSTNKPSDNVFLIAAWHFSQKGTSPITLTEIQQLADSVGLTVPTRIDKTLSAAARDGKALFQKTNGGFAPTVAGELFLKQTYRVKKGAVKVDPS